MPGNLSAFFTYITARVRLRQSNGSKPSILLVFFILAWGLQTTTSEHRKKYNQQNKTTGGGVVTRNTDATSLHTINDPGSRTASNKKHICRRTIIRTNQADTAQCSTVALATVFYWYAEPAPAGCYMPWNGDPCGSFPFMSRSILLIPPFDIFFIILRIWVNCLSNRLTS